MEMQTQESAPRSAKRLSGRKSEKNSSDAVSVVNDDTGSADQDIYDDAGEW